MLTIYGVLRSRASRNVWLALAELAEGTSGLGCVAVVGLPLVVESRLYNVAAVIAGGRVLGYVPKSFLPNCGEFYERRWFSPAACWSGVRPASLTCRRSRARTPR